MEDEHMKEQTRDELPQSAAGKTIMTTEPKFVPKDAAVIHLNRDVEVKIRLIDCVGYLVKGASGYEEAGHERMVKSPVVPGRNTIYQSGSDRYPESDT